MTEAPWVHEFRKRVSWALAPEHFRHGFVGSVVASGTENYDPTYSYDTGETMYIAIEGTCPCGKDVYVTSDGAVKSAELIRFITSEDIADEIEQNTNPYVEYQTEGEVR